MASTDLRTRLVDQGDREEVLSLGRTQIAAMWFNQLAFAVFLTLPYTLAVYMVRAFEADIGTEGTIGRDTGLLAAAASAAQCMTSFLWGAVSDHIGRKPLLMIGNISACLSIIALGLAPNYTTAIVSRFVGGLFTSGIGVAVKTIIAESCNAPGQAKAMGYMTSAMGVGSIAGPTIAGLLTKPCRQFASTFSVCEKNSLLHRRPFFLPCFVSAVLSFSALLSNILTMSESHPKLTAKHVKRGSNDVETSSTDIISPVEISAEPSSISPHSVQEAMIEVEKLLRDSDDRCMSGSIDVASDAETNADPAEGVAKSWHQQRVVVVCMASGGLVTLFMNYVDELTPIYASAQPSAGGLGMPAHQFAQPLTFGGLVLTVYSLFFYPRDQKRWGYMKCCKIGLWVSIPSLLILSFAHTFAQTPWAMQACLFVGIGLCTICKLMALASAAIIINTVAPVDQIGSVNGAAQTLQGLARSLGPFLAGIIWGSSADSGIPGKQYLPFAVSIVGFVTTAVTYMYIVLPT